MRQLTNSTGTVTDTATYTAFGGEVAQSGTTPNPWRYKGAVGYHANASTELLYVRARHLVAALGQWVSPDPLELFDGANSYAYTDSNPTNRIDPSGLELGGTLINDFNNVILRLNCNANLAKLKGDIGKTVQLYDCAKRHGCLIDIVCGRLDKVVDAHYQHSEIVLNAFADPNIFGCAPADFNLSQVTPIVREELYHALTICGGKKGQGFKRWRRELSQMGPALPYFGCIAALYEEIIAKTCAKRCSTFTSCYFQAMQSMHVDKSCKNVGLDSMPRNHPWMVMVEKHYQKVKVFGYCLEIDTSCIPRPVLNPLHPMPCF
ncbi:MAG: RHS repeat-associated core domain-containing protein [Planctomycetales bacterium]|nr:RHS repeat-associated core domain-containing protein [Planctomycetales bacterium]